MAGDFWNTMIEYTAEYKIRQGYITFRIPDDYQIHVDAEGEKCKGFMTVKFGKPRKPRSTGKDSASHHFNGHCQQIAAFIGDSFDDVKLAIKYEARAAGYPGREVAGHWIPQSEADSDTVECSILIETAHRVAAFLSCPLKES